MPERYVSFGEQVGAVTALSLKPGEAPPRFRTAIWNDLGPLFELKGNHRTIQPVAFCARMADDKRWDLDGFKGKSPDSLVRWLKKWLMEQAEWHEVYEFIQSLARWGQLTNPDAVRSWETLANELLFQERAPYRMVKGQLVELTSEQERAEVGKAVEQKGKYGQAGDHMAKALAKFALRPTPDCENAAKEAASAVESALNTANAKALAVGEAVKLFTKTYSVHSALMESASKLFGYASDRDGVRHAGKGGAPVDANEARLVIVCASSWVNFISAKAP